MRIRHFYTGRQLERLPDESRLEYYIVRAAHQWRKWKWVPVFTIALVPDLLMLAVAIKILLL